MADMGKRSCPCQPLVVTINLSIPFDYAVNTSDFVVAAL